MTPWQSAEVSDTMINVCSGVGVHIDCDNEVHLLVTASKSERSRRSDRLLTPKEKMTEMMKEEKIKRTTIETELFSLRLIWRGGRVMLKPGYWVVTIR